MATTEAGDGNPTTVDEANTNATEQKETQEEMATMDAMMKQTQEPSSMTNRGACACCDVFTRKVNLAIEDGFYKLGLAVGKCPCIVLIVVIAILILCMIGLGNLQLEDSIYNLWTPTNSPIWEEKLFTDKYWGDDGGGIFLFVAQTKEEDGNLLTQEILQEWYEFNILVKTELPTIDYKWDNNGTEDTLTFGLYYEDFYPVETLADLGGKGAVGETVPHYYSKVIPFCKPGAFSPVEAQMAIPCAQLSLFDCFSEGGEWFPFDNYLSMTFFSSIAPANPYTYLRSSFQSMDVDRLGEVIGRSCPTFMGEYLPYNLLYGGETRLNASDDASQVSEIKTWRTAVLMDSPYGMAKKIKIGTGQCTYTVQMSFECGEITDEEIDEAKEFYFEWLSLIIDWGLAEMDARNNDDSKLIRLAMWNDRAGSDLLAEAGAGDFVLIFISYFAMIIFAALTAFRPNNLFLSKSEASFFGVVLVILAVAATMGLAGSFVKLAPEASNVIPFIAIGFGVDDMFVLIFAYKFRDNLSVPEMIAETVRVAGSSVALTSVANFLAFLISTQMVLPSVSNFATFGTLIVVLNFIAVIFGFTAILSLSARRQKSGYRDWAFACCFTDCTKYEPENGDALISTTSPSASAAEMLPSAGNGATDSEENTTFEPFFNILLKTPVRVGCLLLCVILFIMGIAGIGQIEVGLPLQEIVPAGSYGADFLDVQVKYYQTQTFSLITDADGANHKAIDWANRFEDWIDTIKTIHEISPLVYPGMDPHTFWALKMQEYLAERKVEATVAKDASYTLQAPFEMPSELVLNSRLCEADRVKFCPTLGAEYYWTQFPSPTVACLLSNSDIMTSMTEGKLSEDCFSYLLPIVPAVLFQNVFIAHQIYIESFEALEDESTTKTNVTGLYVKADKDEVNVFYKYPCNEVQCDGYIFQSEDNGCQMVGACPWYLVDGDFTLQYIGDITPTDLETLYAVPSSNGWKDPDTGRPGKITQQYLDVAVSFMGAERKSSDFIYTDVPKITEFRYSGKGEYEWKLMRKLMSGAVTAYESVSMGTANSKTECDEVLEATEICGAIRNGLSPGKISCSGLEKDSNWYVGQCDYFAVASTLKSASTISDISVTDACTCGGGSGSQALNQLISVTSEKTCFNPTETVSITCSQFTLCADLRSCYEDFDAFALANIADNTAYPECDLADLNAFVTDYSGDAAGVVGYAAQYLAPCLFSYYDQLTQCCQTSIKNVLMVDDSDFSCDDIETYISNDAAYAGAKEGACNAKDRCEYDSVTEVCSNKCYGNVYSDCTALLYPYSTYGPNMAFNYTTLLSMADPDSCCHDTLSAEPVETQACMIPKAGYWNYGNDPAGPTYSYGLACDAATIESVGCNMTGPTYDPSTVMTHGNYGSMIGELGCLRDNIASLPDGCCKNAIDQIMTNSYLLSKECEIDTQMFCAAEGGSGLSSFAISMMNTTGTCFQTIIENAGLPIPILSPKCLMSFVFCASADGFADTFMDMTAETQCGSGYAGVQTRLCDGSGDLPVWSEIDTSNCSILTCPKETGPYGQLWPETPVWNVATVQGGYNPYDDKGKQVNLQLQGRSINEPGTCQFPSTYYARRKCEVDPFSVNGEADWVTPVVECRPALPFSWLNELPTTMCDMLTEEMTGGFMKGANMIAVYPWGDWFVPTDIALAYSKQICEQAMPGCVAFTFDTANNYAYFFDYCGTPITQADLQGTVPNYGVGNPLEGAPWSAAGLSTFADTKTTYLAPMGLEQFTAEYCSAMSFFASMDTDSGVEFIPASDAWTDEGIPEPFCFYNALWLYYKDPTGSGVLGQDSIQFSLNYADLNISNTRIVTTKNSFNIKNMDSDAKAVETIVSLRKTLDKWSAKEDFYVIPGGFVILFYSQYIGVQDYLVTNLLLVTFAIIGVGIVFLLNPIAVVACVVCNIMMIVEVYGFSHYVGLRINGVLVLNIVVAIGLTMEFTAHIGRAFVLTSHSGSISLSEGQDRMKQTLNEMFVPVTLGAITTVIGIAPLSAAGFPYFRLYYFNLYVIIVVFGWLNGVIFQPIILSFYPPKSFEMPNNSKVTSDGQQAAPHNQQASVELGNL